MDGSGSGTIPRFGNICMNKYVLVEKLADFRDQDYPRPKAGDLLKVVHEKASEYRCQDKNKRIVRVNKRHQTQLFNYTRILRLLYG